MSVKDLIAKARAELDTAAPVVVPVEVGGELVDIGFRPVLGTVWADLMAVHPPRPGAVLDGNVGFNSDAVAKDYPLDRVTVDGEPVDAETWADLMGVLTSPGIKLVAAALWGLNQNDPQRRAAELGKARAGAAKRKRRSPAN
ncbi:hypothetical protein [Microbacterium sp. NPDC055455]